MWVRAQPRLVRPRAELAIEPLPGPLQRAIWNAVGWKPHDLQRQVLLDQTRNVLTSAGRRAGKSQMGGYKLVGEAFRAQAQLEDLNLHRTRREYWIVGPEYSDAEKEFRVVWEVLKGLGFKFDKPGSYNNPNTGDMHISLFDGRFQIHAKSAKYPETLVGEGLSGVVMSEAAKLKPSVWLKYVRPTLADFRGWAFFGSTPEGRNWFYDLWTVGQDPTRFDWASYRAPSWVNPYVYRGGVDTELLDKFHEARRQSGRDGILELLESVETSRSVPIGIDPEIWSMFLDMSSESFNQEIAALFTEYVGRVFKDFDEEYHVTDQDYQPDWVTYACADYGFTNPFVWLLLQVDPHGERINILEEYYETGRDTQEAGRDIVSRGLAPRNCVGFYPDPAEPDRTKELASIVRIRPAGPGAVPIAGRVEWIRRFLKPVYSGLDLNHPEQAPRLTIHRRCRNMIREKGAYRYPELSGRASERSAAPENPMKKDDHTIEAFGRFVSGKFGSPWRRGIRNSKVRVGR